MPRVVWWKVAWLLVAVAYAVPVAYLAYGRLNQITRQARTQLIVQHRLWELHPEYPGTPEAWTRFATLLLTDGQLMRRVRSKYGELATDIELDYKRDLAIAHAEVVSVAAAAWAGPLGVLYLAGFLAARRRRVEPPAPTAPDKPVYSEARYRPSSE